MQLKRCVKVDGATKFDSDSFNNRKVNGDGINNSKGGKRLNMGAYMIKCPRVKYP